MKRMYVTITAALAIFLFSAAVSAQRRAAEPVEFGKISKRLYLVKGGSGAQGGAYLGETGVLLIDSKMDKASVDQVLQAVHTITDMPVLFLVNTHSDGDHISGNKFLPPGVTVIAHENCRKEFFKTRDGSASEWENPELAPFMPSVTFRDKMDIHLGGKRVELRYFGTGHTTGDAVVYFPEEKTAFLGDQMFIGRPQLIHSYKGGNSFEHVKTLSKMLESLDAEKFCTGHSEIADRTVVQNHIAAMKKRQARVKALIDRGRDLEDVKAAFDENEGRLVEAIFNEIKSGQNK